jgi:hypothetical protein
MISTAGQTHESHPVWATVVLVFCVLIWPALAIWFLRRYDEPDDTSEDDGGSGGRAPEPPAPDGPVWWPEFERDFAAYVAAVAGAGTTDPAPREGEREVGLPVVRSR